MMILVDTNVFSELTKPRPNDQVVDWLFANRRETLLSTLVVAELSVGIRTTRGADHRALLTGWLRRLIDVHAGRIAPFDLSAAEHWGAFAAPILISEQRTGSHQFDSLIAGQALALDVPIATRNVSDFDKTAVRVIDPWTA